MTRKQAKPFGPGDIVRSDYRVEPFHADEDLRIVEVTRVGRGRSRRIDRALCETTQRPDVQRGWLDAETLALVADLEASR